jgi:hypothetical protein
VRDAEGVTRSHVTAARLAALLRATRWSDCLARAAATRLFPKLPGARRFPSTAARDVPELEGLAQDVGGGVPEDVLALLVLESEELRRRRDGLAADSQTRLDHLHGVV